MTNKAQESKAMAQQTLADRVITAAAGGAVGILITYITAVSTHSEELAGINERLNSLTEKIEAGISDRYRGADALRDFRLRDHRINENARHIEELRGLHKLDRSAD